MEQREQWNSKLGFVLAAIGSAIGLGNIWRFPYIVYSNGGGAFFIPYFCAIFTAGIPILILEYSLGHKYAASTPRCMAKINPKFEWMGWWPIISSAIILCYYSLILSWAAKYALLSITKGWSADTKNFFYSDFLQASASPTSFNRIIIPILLGIALIWSINFFVCFKGVKKGIEKASKILLPVLLGIMIFIVVRSVMMDGALDGLNVLFQPKWESLTNPKIWISAYGQVFFSLSVATGIMMTYASYLPAKTDINNSAFMTAFANCGFEFLCAIGVFSILGAMAKIQNIPVEEIASSGIGLAFIVFPNIFNQLGVWGNILGVLFFLCLFFAGVTSSVSLAEAISAAFSEKFHISKKKIVSIVCGFGFLVSTIFATDAGIYLLDIMDAYINNYGIVTVGLIEAVVVGWYLKPAVLREHANSMSYFKIGKWWDVVIKYVTPVMLIITIGQSIVAEFTSSYGGYDRSALFLYGWSVIVIGLVTSIIISKRPWKDAK